MKRVRTYSSGLARARYLPALPKDVVRLLLLAVAEHAPGKVRQVSRQWAADEAVRALWLAACLRTFVADLRHAADTDLPVEVQWKNHTPVQLWGMLTNDLPLETLSVCPRTHDYKFLAGDVRVCCRQFPVRLFFRPLSNSSDEYQVAQVHQLVWDDDRSLMVMK